MCELISVVIPTYNRAEVLLDAINSVLSQTYKNFEIIIVDDGSTDNTQEIIKKINDARIKYFYQENSGVSSARNKGIKTANGDYIAFLDSDDLWHPQKLEKQLAIFTKDKNIGLVSCNSLYQTFSGETVFVKKSFASNKKEVISYILSYPDKVYTGTPTLMIKKDCFDKVGYFDEQMSFCEDWDIFFRIALFYEIYFIDEILTYVRVQEDNSTKTGKSEKFGENYKKFLDKAFNNNDLPENFFSLKKIAYSNAFWNFGSGILYRSKNRCAARKALLKSLTYSCSKLLNIKFLIALILSFSPEFMLNIYGKLKKFSGKKY
jgi:glycosyltransferase involved in cell wall biosynthesis